MSSSTKRAVLAFSGGLDTSYCVLWLRDQGYEVHTVTVNTGGFDPETIREIEGRSEELGAASHRTLDATEQFYRECIRFLVFGNVLRNGTYPLSVSAERHFQARIVAEEALGLHADALVHGSTGAGNDQVRFDMAFLAIAPEIPILSPVRDQRITRDESTARLRQAGIEIPEETRRYSINQGIWGTSVGGAETLTSNLTLPQEAYPVKVTESGERDVTLRFEQGEISAVDGESYDSPVDAIVALEKIAAPYGVGRGVHVGDTIIGIKGRVGFAAAAPVLLIDAHRLLEKHVLSKWQIYWKDQLANWYGMFVHEARFDEPVMRNIEAFMESTQSRVSGDVSVRLAPHRYTLVGLESPYDMLQSSFGQYGEMNEAWSGDDVRGFTRVLSVPERLYRSIENPK